MILVFKKDSPLYIRHYKTGKTKSGFFDVPIIETRDPQKVFLGSLASMVKFENIRVIDIFKALEPFSDLISTMNIMDFKAFLDEATNQNPNESFKKAILYASPPFDNCHNFEWNWSVKVLGFKETMDPDMMSLSLWSHVPIEIQTEYPALKHNLSPYFFQTILKGMIRQIGLYGTPELRDEASIFCNNAESSVKTWFFENQKGVWAED